MMKIESLDQYQQLALRTARSTLKDDVRQCNWAMGLAGEVGELFYLLTYCKTDLDKIEKELGDVWWYAAVMANEYGYNLSDIWHEGLGYGSIDISNLVVESAYLLDYIQESCMPWAPDG